MIYPASKLFAAMKEKCRDADNTKGGKKIRKHIATQFNFMKWRGIKVCSPLWALVVSTTTTIAETVP